MAGVPLPGKRRLVLLTFGLLIAQIAHDMWLHRSQPDIPQETEATRRGGRHGATSRGPPQNRKIVSLNVRHLSEGTLLTTIREAKQQNIDVLLLQSTGWRGRGAYTRDGYHIFWEGKKHKGYAVEATSTANNYIQPQQPRTTTTANTRTTATAARATRATRVTAATSAAKIDNSDNSNSSKSND